MKKFTLILSFIFISCYFHALPIQLSQNSINFGEIEINQTQSAEFYLKNIYHSQQIISISRVLSAIELSDSLITIPTQDSILIQVLFTGNTNIHYESVLIFRNQLNHTPFFLPVSAECKLPNNEYSSTYNLFDNDLKNELFNLINAHISVGYTTAREHMYGSIDNIDGFVECVYTGILVETNGIPDGNIMNCEHTWPQSLGATGIARSDLHHMFPCDPTANNIRGNLPFGEISGNPNWQQGGSKRGYNSQGVLVFEPRDVHKGDVARCMMYFALRYENPFSPFFDNQELILKQWNNNFEVSEKEFNRNLAIEQIQVKKNPFVVHSNFANRIYSISSQTQTPQTINLIYPNTINYENFGHLSIPLFNNGNAIFSISSVTTNSQSIEILNFPQIISSKEVSYIEIDIIPSSEQTHTITINDSYQINLIFTNVNINENTQTLQKYIIYPNPVNSLFYLKQNTVTESIVKIYNIKGQIVKSTLISQQLNPVKMPDNISSGVYFIKIYNEGNVFINKLLFIK